MTNTILAVWYDIILMYHTEYFVLRTSYIIYLYFV